MISFSYKQINNVLVDSSDYSNVFTHIINIPRKILFLEKHFLPNFYKTRYKRGIYIIGDKKPILDFRDNFIDVGQKELQISSITDIEEIFENNDKIYVKSNIILNVLSKNDFTSNRMLFTEFCTYPLFTEDFLNMAISFYMRNTNSEKELVDNDTFNISEHISLFNTEYKDMDLKDFFNINGIDDNIMYEDLLINYELLFMDIIEICSKFNPLSVKVKINNNLIQLMFYDSPSSRRYNINKIYTDHPEDISMYEDL